MCENECATRSLTKIWHPGRADLDKKSAQMWCDLHPAGCISQREEADQNHNRSCTPNHWPLWSMENLELYSMVILVATNGHQHRSFLQVVRKVPDQQNWHAETTRVSTQLANTRQAVAVSALNSCPCSGVNYTDSWALNCSCLQRSILKQMAQQNRQTIL